MMQVRLFNTLIAMSEKFLQNL